MGTSVPNSRQKSNPQENRPVGRYAGMLFGPMLAVKSKEPGGALGFPLRRRAIPTFAHETGIQVPTWGAIPGHPLHSCPAYLDTGHVHGSKCLDVFCR